MSKTALYDDGKIACDETGLLIRRYYPWGAKHIPYTSIESVRRLPIRIRRWRLWGTGDFRHWWNLDVRRPRTTIALQINTGHWIHPTITPDDPDAVERILTDHLAVEPSAPPTTE
jgi:hypothetical protein